jgi:hypothetical protein
MTPTSYNPRSGWLVLAVRGLLAQLWCLGLLRALRLRPRAALADPGADALVAPRPPGPLVSAVAVNLAALATELRETGELTQLLARAAAGHPLDEVEWAKVRAQLIDLAKIVPALAVLAAPGGLLLLPLLAKILPWRLLPSAWDRPRLPPASPVRADPPQA